MHKVLPQAQIRHNNRSHLSVFATGVVPGTTVVLYGFVLRDRRLFVLHDRRLFVLRDRRLAESQDGGKGLVDAPCCPGRQSNPTT